MQLHEDEFEIDVDLVRRLLRMQMPDLAGLSLTRFESSGPVNAIYRLGEALDARLAVHQHHVPTVLGSDGAAEYARPERAHGS